MNQTEQLVPKKRVIALFAFMVSLPAIYMLLRGAGLISVLFLLMFPSGIFGYLKYISEPTFNAARGSLEPIFIGWLIFFALLGVGIVFRSEHAHRRWLIGCVIIFLLTWGGCGLVDEILPPCTDAC